jgi:hypothetical protein
MGHCFPAAYLVKHCNSLFLHPTETLLCCTFKIFHLKLSSTIHSFCGWRIIFWFSFP